MPALSTMRAAVLASREHGVGHLVCEDAPLPTPDTGAALVRTLVASICGSDFHIVDLAYYARGRPSVLPGPPGFPGHESVVEVADAPGNDLEPGQLALAVPPAHLSFAFAEYQAVPIASLIPLPDTAAWDTSVLAQQLGTVSYAFDTFWTGPLEGLTVAIVGAGSAGILFTLEARRRGAATVIVTDPSAARLAVAARAGADRTVRASGTCERTREELAEVVTDVTDGHGAPLVIDASGRDDGRSCAVAALGRDGTLGVFGLPMRDGSSPFDLAALFERRGRLITAHSAQLEPGLRSFRSALDRIAAGELDPLELPMDRFPLEQIDEAFITARRREGVVKVLIDVGTPGR